MFSQNSKISLLTFPVVNVNIIEKLQSDKGTKPWYIIKKLHSNEGTKPWYAKKIYNFFITLFVLYSKIIYFHTNTFELLI